MAIERFNLHEAISSDELVKTRENNASEVHAYLAYEVAGKVVHFEFVAKQLSEEFVSYPVSMQHKIASAILEKVPAIGDQLILTTPENKRGGRLIRVKYDGPEEDTGMEQISLVVTH